MKFSIKPWFSVTVLGLAMLLAVVSVAAQDPTNATQKVEPPTLTGKYEGTLKDETGDQKVTLELTEESGKFWGTLTTARGSFKITNGKVVDNALTFEIEKPADPRGTFALRRDGSNLIATIAEKGQNITLELRKVVADEISGEWDAVADASGQPFSFTLTLKLEGEKVTGSSASQLGNSNVSSGSWKDGKLAVILEGGSGQIALAATMIDGKLSGDYDYAGQLQGKWVAIRKK